jgi:polyvinyl alcohol dehydrogenase (cytochrome)
MYSLTAANRAIEWKFSSRGAVASGAAIVDGTAYRGTAYQTKALGRPYDGDSNKLYASMVSDNASRK